jgi:MSHA pilin protein MshD
MCPDTSRIRGISLLEFVLGLVILSVVLGGVTLFFAAQPRQLDPVFQYRAVSLAEALAEQVLAVRYDDQNDPYAPGHKRCDIGSEAPDCRNAPTAGAGAKLKDFSHVDDFRLWCGNENAIAGDTLADDMGLAQAGLYARYRVQSCVEGKNDGTVDYKEVTLRVLDQNGADLAFVLHRYNIR